MNLTKEQQNKNLILTLIQYTTLFTFLILTPYMAIGIGWQIMELFGILLGVWAIWVMNESKMHIMPKPRSGAKLIRKGPYRIIRHPMYVAIIFSLTPLIITHFDWIRFWILLVLYINLVFKLTFEETLLVEYFEDYDEYRKSSWKLIPYLF